MPGKFEIRNAKNGHFYFNLKASNGEVILTSETYKAKASAKNGIASVQKNAGLAARFEKKTSPKGKLYFVLKAGNHEAIGRSEMYETEKARDTGIASVQANAPGSSTADLTIK